MGRDQEPLYGIWRFWFIDIDGYIHGFRHLPLFGTEMLCSPDTESCNWCPISEIQASFFPEPLFVTIPSPKQIAEFKTSVRNERPLGTLNHLHSWTIHDTRVRKPIRETLHCQQVNENVIRTWDPRRLLAMNPVKLSWRLRRMESP